jgi:excisionase family DNA binding protein
MGDLIVPAGRMFNVRDVSDTLGISVGLAHKLIDDGVLPAVRVGLKMRVVPRAALVTYVNRNTTGDVSLMVA